jgi:hypothetical protein
MAVIQLQVTLVHQQDIYVSSCRSFCYAYFENHFVIPFRPSKWLYSGVRLWIIAARPQDVYPFKCHSYVQTVCGEVGDQRRSKRNKLLCSFLQIRLTLKTHKHIYKYNRSKYRWHDLITATYHWQARLIKGASLSDDWVA